ncbi:hypothetical protein LIA77_01975 [Sarocladium implicatum]|nr:hypothetical protein LIA77_01975 [Sarocladium implicatum]
MMLHSLLFFAFVASASGGHLVPANLHNPALARRHLLHERQASCFNDLVTGQPQSCIASASCCRGVRYSTCVRNGDVCCDFVNSMGSCPAGYTCQQNSAGEPSCEPPSTGGGGGNRDDGDDNESVSVDFHSSFGAEDTTTSFVEDVTTTSSVDDFTTTSVVVVSTSSEVETSSTISRDQEQDEASASATDPAPETQDSGSDTLTKAKLVGIIISIVAAVCGIIFGIVRLIMKHNKHKKEAAMRNSY